MKILIIYHRSDWDGKASKIITKLFIPEANTIGWDYGDPTPDVSGYDKIYCVDISVRDLFMQPEIVRKTVWIDHHKTAIAEFGDLPFLSKYLIDGVAACRLVWQYFKDVNFGLTFELRHYKLYNVNEPNIIQWLGEHDVWDHRNSEARITNSGMDLLGEDWLAEYLKLDPDDYAVQEQEREVIKIGELALKTKETLYKEIAQNAIKLNDWHNNNWWVINTALKESGQFDSLDKTDRDCFIKWCLTSKGVEVSLYTDNKNKDLSVIAKKYGGGGHAGACGFLLENLTSAKNVFPFIQ